jgi:hypothetical protein
MVLIMLSQCTALIIYSMSPNCRAMPALSPLVTFTRPSMEWLSLGF